MALTTAKGSRSFQRVRDTVGRMDTDEPFFWTKGILATDLVEVTSDSQRIESGGFWVIVITFEGAQLFARFASVQRNAPFPSSQEWGNLESIWRSSLSQTEYENYVEELRKVIAEGQVYQVNACRILTTPAPEISLASLFAKILVANPAPFASFLRLPDLEIASASPELFLERDGLNIKTSPIKGTQRPSTPEESSKKAFGLKDQSENIMIVDLMRNDLSRISAVGSVTVGELLRTEDHPGLRHLVSDVCGVLKSEVKWEEIFDVLIPPGSVSGAPKSSALKLIEQFESEPRGIYCGTFGWIEGDQSSLCVTIRTFWSQAGVLHFGTGAGITWGSDPHQEWRETELKANRLIGLAGGVDEDGWQYGTGIFETLLVEQGTPILFDKHMQRAGKSAQEFGIVIPPRAEVLGAISRLANYSSARVRLSFGSLGNQFSIDAKPYEESHEPLRISILDAVSQAGIGPHKQFPFGENLDLLKEAQLKGFDEVLLIDKWGIVGEGATCSYLFYIEGSWKTPPLSSGVLPGIMRDLAIENSLVSEHEIRRKDLADVQAMMALSSLRIAIPIAELNGRKLAIGEHCELLYEQLQRLARSHSVD